MARIKGVDIPNNKRVEISLTYVYGIGRSLAKQILKNVNESIDADMEIRLKVGKVIECVEHPESDHLHVCKVDVGSEVLQIVCGAHNVCEGILVVCACENAVMPNGKLITPGKLRGVESYGMLCSAYELGLIEEPKRGLLILDESYIIGNEFRGN